MTRKNMKTNDTTASAAAGNAITLDTPLERGDTPITTLTLRKPRSGELRGVALTDLLQMDVTALQTVVPRISTPMLTKADMANLDPADLVQIGTVVAGFLLTKEAKGTAFLNA
jgi:Phage tail assembly chaperone proteins, E, or 41 or 14